MQRSTVKWFDAKKGYGFLQHPDGGDDVFVHYSQILSESDFKTLRTGQEVDFEISDGPKGLHALDVKPIGEDAEAVTKKADAEAEAAGQMQPASSSEETETASASPSPDGDGRQVSEDEEEPEDEWANEDWTDEYGNPPDPMAGPTF